MRQQNASKRLCAASLLADHEQTDQRKEFCGGNLTSIDDIKKITQDVIGNNNIKKQGLKRIVSSIRIAARNKLLLKRSNDNHQIGLRFIELEQEGTDQSKEEMEKLEAYIREDDEGFWEDGMQESERMIKEVSEDLGRKLVDTAGHVPTELLNNRSLQLAQCEEKIEELNALIENNNDEILHLQTRLAEEQDKMSPNDRILQRLSLANQRIERIKPIHEEAVFHNQELSAINGKLTTELRNKDYQIRATVERELVLAKQLKEAKLSLETTTKKLTETESKLTETESALTERDDTITALESVETNLREELCNSSSNRENQLGKIYLDTMLNYIDQ